MKSEVGADVHPAKTSVWQWLGSAVGMVQWQF